MSLVHQLKNTPRETVLKIYRSDSSGGVIDIEPDSVKVANTSQRFVGSQSQLHIKEIYWGSKKDKQINITRVTDSAANTVHGFYYLTNTGHYDYNGFTDSVYANCAIRVEGDGPFHVILVLHKNGYVNI